MIGELYYPAGKAKETAQQVIEDYHCRCKFCSNISERWSRGEEWSSNIWKKNPGIPKIKYQTILVFEKQGVG